jgi:dTDP-glucose 4,6-dehydratase
VRTWLILGGGGWLGVQVSRYLLARVPDILVVGVGRNQERPAPFALHRGIDDARYEYHQIHLAYEPERILSLMQNRRPEIVINLAAQGEEAASWTNAWRYLETNVVALAKVVEPLVGASWLRRWVQISTASVYGPGSEPAREDFPLRPSTPYAVSKAAADGYLSAIGAVQSFPVNIVRPANVYGPGQQLHRIVSKAALCALTGRALPLHGGGAARKFFLYAEDMARALHTIAEKAAPGAIYNVGPREGTSIRSLVETICRKVGVRFEDVVQLAPGRGGQDTQATLDSSRLTAELGWVPMVDLDKGLDETIAWMKQHLDVLKVLPAEFTFRA